MLTAFCGICSLREKGGENEDSYPSDPFTGLKIRAWTEPVLRQPLNSCMMTTLHTHARTHARTHMAREAMDWQTLSSQGRDFPIAETVPAEVAALDRASLGHRNASDAVPSNWTLYKSRFFLSINAQNMVNETNEM